MKCPVSSGLKLGPTFSQYYNAIVGIIMQLSDLSSKIRDLPHWGRKICSTDIGPTCHKYYLEGHRPEVCPKYYLEGHRPEVSTKI